MQLHQLRYFVAVAELRHFTQAADLVGITQPSLSKQVHALEAELGTPLFDRVRGRITLTPAGELLLASAKRILADVETAHRQVQELVGLRRGRVRLGATPSLVTSLAPPVLRQFRDRYPGIDLQVEEGGSQDLVRGLLRGDLDLALIILPAQGIDPGLRAEPILRESLVLASLDPLPATATGDLRLTDLRDQPLVMFRQGYDLRDVTLQACRSAGFEPTFAVEGGEMDAVLSFVEAGLGVALVPGIVVARRPGIRITPLAPPGVERTIAVAQRRDAVPTNAGRELHRILLDHIRDATARGQLPPGVEPLADHTPSAASGAGQAPEPASPAGHTPSAASIAR